MVLENLGQSCQLDPRYTGMPCSGRTSRGIPCSLVPGDVQSAAEGHIDGDGPGWNTHAPGHQQLGDSKDPDPAICAGNPRAWPIGQSNSSALAQKYRVPTANGVG